MELRNCLWFADDYAACYLIAAQGDRSSRDVLRILSSNYDMSFGASPPNDPTCPITCALHGEAWYWVS